MSSWIEEAAVGIGEAVVGIGPRLGLGGILPGRGDAGRQLGQPEAAALPDRRERLAPAPEIERDLIRCAHPVAAGHGGHGQNGSVYAA
jgi:hypothetical protein